MQYEYLTRKGKIGALTLKNRTVMPAMETSLASLNGEVNDDIIAYYEARAKGGCALIITEITRVDELTGRGAYRQICATSGGFIPGIEKLARAIHKHNSKIFLQLHHPGRQCHSRVIEGRQIVAPSAIMSKAIMEMPRELTTAEVEDLVKKFVMGAAIAQMAGVDGVELHAAHGYLLCQFLSPQSNKRTDKYGGNFTNRARILAEIITGIKHICGPNFPISVRIDGDEFVEGGIRLDEAVKIARYLESLGVDAINVSSGTYESAATIIEPIAYSEGWKRHLSQAVKDAVKIPVIACDAIKTPQFAEQLLAEGNTDFVALGRSQIADPEFINKALRGEEADIRPCIGCLHCIESVMKGRMLQCAVNPCIGHEKDYQSYAQNGEGRTVAVVGAGPAGMEAARVLGKKGFKPVIFEKEAHSGGAVYAGSKPPHKARLQDFIDNMHKQAADAGATFRMGEAATLESLQALNPYAVYIAIGGENVKVPVKDAEHVRAATDVLAGALEVTGKRIVVAGSGMTGLETAEYLADKGNDVTIIEMAKEIGPGIHKAVLFDIQARLHKMNVKMVPERQLLNFDQGKVAMLDTFSTEMKLQDADYLVLALGVRGQEASEFVTSVQDQFERVVLLGDTLRGGKIYDAVLTGFERAYILE